MAAIMAAIGVFGGAPTGLVGRLFDAGNDADHWLWMALAFALPPIARVALSIVGRDPDRPSRDVKGSEEHTSELQSLMRISYAVFCLKKKNTKDEHCTMSNRISTQRTQT